MKILITTDLFSTKTNGVVTSVRNLWDELKSRGHDVRILTLSENRHSYQDGAVFYVRSMPLGVYPDVRMPTSYRHKYIKEMVAWKPDIIHSQCEFFSFQFANYIAKRTGAPIVHTYHTLYERYVSYVIPNEKLGKWAVRVLSKKRLKGVKTIIVPTHKVEEKLRSYGIANPITVMPSGICLEQHKIRITNEEKSQKRRSLNIPDNAVVLINLGRLGTEKNLEELLQYFANLSRTDANTWLMIVGDGPEKKNLESLADTLGIGNKVVFTGMVDPTEVHAYYQLGDIFVNASTSETQGLTYIEAAANGLPLVCRRDPCLDDVICEGVNGFEYDTESDFKSYIRHFVYNADRRRIAGEYSERCVHKFDKAVFGETAERLYNTVINDDNG